MGTPNPPYCMTQLSNKGNEYKFANPSLDMRRHDCNVVQTAMGIRAWSNDTIRPTSVQLRDIGADHSGGTGTLLSVRCFEHYGMVLGQDFFRFYRQDFSVVRQMNADGLYVVLFIDNGVLNGIDGGIYSGALAFSGAHAIGTSGRWRSSGKRQWWIYDSCYDGRWSKLVNGGQGGRYPLGRTPAPVYAHRNAAAAYAQSPEGVYLASGYAIKYR